MRNNMLGIKELSEKGLDCLKNLEAFRSHVYKDSGGHPTIGWGHLLTRTELLLNRLILDAERIDYSKGITEDIGTRLLDRDNDESEKAVDRYVTADLSVQQFDALVIFTYNIGISAFKESTLLKLLNQGKYKEVPNQLMRWINVDRKPNEGLYARRTTECNIWSKGDYTVMYGKVTAEFHKIYG